VGLYWQCVPVVMVLRQTSGVVLAVCTSGDGVETDQPVVMVLRQTSGAVLAVCTSGDGVETDQWGCVGSVYQW